MRRSQNLKSEDEIQAVEVAVVPTGDRDEVQVAEVEYAVAVRIPNDRFVAWRTANAATGRPTL